MLVLPSSNKMTTSFRPLELGGVVNVILVSFTATKPVAAAPPIVTPVAPVSLNLAVAVTVISAAVPPAVVPEAGVTVHLESALHTAASAGTAILVTTGISAAAIWSARRREMGSSNFDTPRRSSPFCSSSSRAARTTVSSFGAPVASWRILAISVIVRCPSESFQTSAAV